VIDPANSSLSLICAKINVLTVCKEYKFYTVQFTTLMLNILRQIPCLYLSVFTNLYNYLELPSGNYISPSRPALYAITTVITHVSPKEHFHAASAYITSVDTHTGLLLQAHYWYTSSARGCRIIRCHPI